MPPKKSSVKVSVANLVIAIVSVIVCAALFLWMQHEHRLAEPKMEKDRTNVAERPHSSKFDEIKSLSEVLLLPVSADKNIPLKSTEVPKTDTRQSTNPPPPVAPTSPSQKKPGDAHGARGSAMIEALFDNSKDQHVAVQHQSNTSVHDGPLAWSKFISIPQQSYKTERSFDFPGDDHVKVCSKELADLMTKPALSDEKYKWCQWTLDANGGGVKVGKSYGKLNAKERDEYEQLNCNAVAKGQNPSCDDAWGDGQILSWKNNPTKDLCGHTSGSTGSKIKCYDSSSEARFCTFENVMMDFTKMHNVKRPGRSDSRSWDPGFLISDCPSSQNLDYYPFYSTGLNPGTAVCDKYVTETVVMMSHDNIHNLGHSMSDFMNVWAMMWMAGIAQYSNEMIFMNIDAIRMGHNYHDVPNQFFVHYERNFRKIIKAADYDGTKVCFKNLIFMPRPVILFTWDGWWQDMRCSFVGPSSLFQRWNLQLRQSYGLLRPEAMPTNSRWKILLVFRRVKGSSASQYATRVFANEKEIEDKLRTIPGVELEARDLSDLPFEDQIKLIASSSMLIGMHGAGVASAMHMAVGTKFCCGVVEIFPEGEFRPIRGYGNMARRMGHHYERLETAPGDSGMGGARVDADVLLKLTSDIIGRINTKRSCALPSTVKNPYFLKN